jgi:thiol:disulfide interchange protein
MRKLTLTLLVAMLAVFAASAIADETAPAATDKPHAPYLTNLDEALAQASKENKHLLVDFYAEW